MTTIRVGIIGLSANTVGVSWAAKAHLPYLQTSDKYQLVALCNSSESSAKAAIAHFKLSESTKAYGDPKEMAKDSDIDMVVCCTSVEHHYNMLLPFLEAGKDCYTEVPLAVDIENSRELQAIAERNKVRTIFGIQGQANPAINTIKTLVEEGKIGKVLSTTITGYAAAFTGEPLGENKAHLFNRAAGANMMTVWFLHSEFNRPRKLYLLMSSSAFNFILHVMGELESFDSMLATVRPKIDIFKETDSGRKTVRTVTSNTPDQILIQGKFESGALLSFHMEGGEPFPGDSALKWHIVGEKGELMITNNLMMMDVMHKGVKILFFDYSEKELLNDDFLEKKGDGPTAQEIQLPEDEMAHLHVVAANVGRIYEAVATGKTDHYADWSVALRRHEMINELFERWDNRDTNGNEAQHMRRQR